MTVRGAGPTSLGCFGVVLTISMVALRTTLVTSHCYPGSTASLLKLHICFCRFVRVREYAEISMFVCVLFPMSGQSQQKKKTFAN